MNAIRIEKFGSASCLQFKKVDFPDVPESLVLVKVMAVGVNPVDVYIREGAFSTPQLPFTPGMDGSGIIAAIGKNVTHFKVDQRVFICGRNLGTYGTYAEYSLVPEVDLFPLEEKLNFPQGAALGIPYFTAHRALVFSARCFTGETVLIHGASGGVGLACTQVAKNLGLKVIGTAGTKEGMDIVKENGADFVLCHKDKNYMKEVLVITEQKGVDIVIEMAADVNLDKDLDVVAPKGRIAIVGCRGPVKMHPGKMMMPEIEVMGVAVLSSSVDEWVKTSNAILKGIQDGWVKPVIDRTYPLADASKAQEYMMNSPGAKGKIVLSVQD